MKLVWINVAGLLVNLFFYVLRGNWWSLATVFLCAGSGIFCYVMEHKRRPLLAEIAEIDRDIAWIEAQAKIAELERDLGIPLSEPTFPKPGAELGPLARKIFPKQRGEQS